MLLQENLVVADRFRLVRMIGRGGMGSVWQAVQLALDQPCALKFIEGEVTNVADAHARFEREAKAAAQLRSPHVVQIIDHGVWQGRPFIAMELLEGEDLSATLHRAGGKLPPARVNTIVQQVCRALTRAHQAGVVHRDLKPDNIFLVNDDDRQLVKILDFGVAKQTAQAIDGSNTKTGAMLGTPYYMSPEQAQGIKSVDARSDLWSLAVIVYQCLTGERPFDSNALGDLLVKIIVQPVPTPSQVPQVPPGFDRWWARAAERNPDNRFPNAKEFASSLAIALGVTAETDAATTGNIPKPQAGQAHRTAFMQNVPQSQPQPQPQSHQHAPGPAPQQQTAAFAAAATPQPSNQTPQPYDQAQHHQHQQGHSPSHPGFGLGGTGNPATFSGVEPPVTIPKKNPPVAVLAGIGAVVLIGVISAGVVVARRSSAGSMNGNSTGTSTASISATADVPSATPSETAATTASEEPPVAASASASASASAEVAANTPATNPNPNPNPNPNTNPNTPKGIVAPKTTTTTSAKPTPTTSGSTKRPSMDERKW